MLSSQGYYNDELSLEEAVTYLRLLLHEFPFSDWYTDPDESSIGPQSRSQAVQVAAMLSQFARGLIPRASRGLGFIYTSNSQRSGKTLLMKLAIIPVNGQMATQTWNSKEEELRKVIDAEMLAASRYIVFDNAKAFVSSGVIEALLTASVWKGRVLTRSQMFTVPNMMSIYISGNDMTVSPDIAHRCLTVDLFVTEANVQERKVAKPIDDDWLMKKDNRIAILSALWAIVRHWDHDGRPLATQNLRVGFERWCEVIGGLVNYAGFGDCLAAPALGEAEIDQTDRDMNALVRSLAREIIEEGEKHVDHTFQEVVDVAHESGLFDWMLDGKQEFIEGKPTGHYVLKHDASSRFSFTLRKYAPEKKTGRVFRLAADKAVKMFCTGKQRHRRYVIEVA